VLNRVPRIGLEEEARRKFAIDRQKLLDRLEDPQEGDANLGLDAPEVPGLQPPRRGGAGGVGAAAREYLYP
jgi:hypothetical protein